MYSDGYLSSLPDNIWKPRIPVKPASFRENSFSSESSYCRGCTVFDAIKLVPGRLSSSNVKLWASTIIYECIWFRNSVWNCWSGRAKGFEVIFCVRYWALQRRLGQPASPLSWNDSTPPLVPTLSVVSFRPIALHVMNEWCVPRLWLSDTRCRAGTEVSVNIVWKWRICGQNLEEQKECLEK